MSDFITNLLTDIAYYFTENWLNKNLPTKKGN